MSAPARRAKVERTGAELSVRRQCALLNVARSGVYRPQPETSAEDLTLMRRIDELYLEKPFYGSRRMTFDLNEEGHGVNRKRVQRLMRLMGLEGLVPRPGTSKAAPGNKIYPYLLRGDHRASLEAYFREHPPASVKEAMAKIEELTGIKRSPDRVRAFLKRMGMKCRKVGMIPAKADIDAQEDFKKNSSSRAWRKPRPDNAWSFSSMPRTSF